MDCILIKLTENSSTSRGVFKDRVLHRMLIKEILKINNIDEFITI